MSASDIHIDQSKAPLVSIVIPCYNGFAHLREAAQSALSQSYPELEIILVDDGSDDQRSRPEIEQLAKEDKRIRAEFHDKNRGLAAARNTGARMARGKYILPLDSDDRIHTNFLSETTPILESNLNVGFVYTDSEFFGAEEGVHPAREFDLAHALAYQTFGCTILYRKSDYEACGGYCEELRLNVDWDFQMSLMQTGKIGVRVPKPLFYYRQHEKGSLSDHTWAVRDVTYRKLITRHQALFEQHWVDILCAKERRIASLIQTLRDHSRWQEKVKRTFPYRVFRKFKRIWSAT